MNVDITQLSPLQMFIFVFQKVTMDNLLIQQVVADQSNLVLRFGIQRSSIISYNISDTIETPSGIIKVIPTWQWLLWN